MKPESDAHNERARDNEENRDRRKEDVAAKKKRLEKFLSEGLTNEVIAQRLGVTGRQVRKWKRELREAPGEGKGEATGEGSASEEAGSNGSGKPA